MRKIFVVAKSEVLSYVQTKAFLVSIVLLPVMMFGSAAATSLLKNTDTKARQFAVVDHTGTLFPALVEAAKERDGKVDANPDERLARFLPVEEKPREGESLDDLRLRLSASIKKDELFAFIELPKSLLAMEAAPNPGEELEFAYNSDSPTYQSLREWLNETLTTEVRSRRYDQADVATDVRALLEKKARAQNMGLWERSADGRVRPAEKVNAFRLFAVPIGSLVLMFLLVMIGAPPLLNAVIEEKVSRISEVLLGSVTPFQLMLGKLLGCTAVSLGLAALYIGGLLGVAISAGLVGLIPLTVVVYFAIFLVLAMLLYGSLYLAVGAACSDMREAQSLMMPVMILQMTPFFLFRPVLESPSGSFSVAASMFPLASPFLMMMRLGLQPTPPLWQVLSAVALTTLTTIACVWAASRIFRVGLLVQGKPPSFGLLLRWIFSAD